eukprot:809443-Pyramimonas_sp.AAC.1
MPPHYIVVQALVRHAQCCAFRLVCPLHAPCAQWVHFNLQATSVCPGCLQVPVPSLLIGNDRQR